jgi:pteridine reductase
VAEQWDDQLAVNLTAPQRCIRLAIERGATAIVNVVDIAAWQPWREFSAYCVSKAGLLHLTLVLARELAPAVRVNAVAPGTVLFGEDLDEAARARVLARIPMGRAGQPADVARAVRFLLTEPYLTGVCLPVDGGQGV